MRERPLFERGAAVFSLRRPGDANTNPWNPWNPWIRPCNPWNPWIGLPLLANLLSLGK